jgi:hypothetical protein
MLVSKIRTFDDLIFFRPQRVHREHWKRHSPEKHWKRWCPHHFRRSFSPLLTATLSLPVHRVPVAHKRLPRLGGRRLLDVGNHRNIDILSSAISSTIGTDNRCRSPTGADLRATDRTDRRSLNYWPYNRNRPLQSVRQPNSVFVLPDLVQFSAPIRRYCEPSPVRVHVECAIEREEFLCDRTLPDPVDCG